MLVIIRVVILLFKSKIYNFIVNYFINFVFINVVNCKINDLTFHLLHDKLKVYFTSPSPAIYRRPCGLPR